MQSFIEDLSIISDGFVKLMVFIFIVTLIFVAISQFIPPKGYQLTSETFIVDKFITYRESDGQPRYYLIYKDENGTIRQEHVNPDIYYRFEIDEEKGE